MYCWFMFNSTLLNHTVFHWSLTIQTLSGVIHLMPVTVQLTIKSYRKFFILLPVVDQELDTILYFTPNI